MSSTKMEDSKLFQIGKIAWMIADCDEHPQYEKHIFKSITEFERDYGKVDEMLASFFSQLNFSNLELLEHWMIKRGGKPRHKVNVPWGYWPKFPQSWNDAYLKARREAAEAEDAAEEEEKEGEANMWRTAQLAYNAECEAAYARAMERKHITGVLW